MLSRQDRLRLAAAAALIVMAGVMVAVVEVGLRLWPGPLGQAFVNGVHSRYSTREGGMYYRDPRLGMVFMIPNYRTQMQYNGYAWTHESDALGFRNRAVSIPGDIVLLGDSYIYGHGVDIENTVGAFLERMTGLRVANLARQGDCVFQQAYLLTEYIGMFRPRHVLYFFSENDIGDLSSSTTRRCASSSPLPSSRSVIRPGRNRPSLSGSARRAFAPGSSGRAIRPMC
jgi:hypothetical protein